MIRKNKSGQGVPIYAQNSSGAPATGEAANIIGLVSIDGGDAAAFSTANPTAITGMDGWYWQPLTQAESNGNMLALGWTCSTAGVKITPWAISTTGPNIPAADLGASGGHLVYGSLGGGQLDAVDGAAPISGTVVLAPQVHTGATIPTVGTVTDPVGANVQQWLGEAVQATHDGIPNVNVVEAEGGSLSAFEESDPWAILLSGGTTYTGNQAGALLGQMTQAWIRQAVGLASANLDTQLGTLLTAAALVAGIKAKTDTIPASPAQVGDIPTAVQNADALLGRSHAGGSNTGRLVKHALGTLLNKIVLDPNAGTITAYGPDDTTVYWAGAITLGENGQLLSIDPT